MEMETDDNLDDNEYYLLNLNWEGNDYQIRAENLETANLLLNDSEAAANYLQQRDVDASAIENPGSSSLDASLPSAKCAGSLRTQKNTTEKDVETTTLLYKLRKTYEKTCNNRTSNDLVQHITVNDDAKETTDSSLVSCSQTPASAVHPIWTRKKPTRQDLEATTLLLKLRQKHEKAFDDKKTSKAKLWHLIAQEMKTNNFVLGENSGERCRQKFANLTKSYLGYIKHQKRTGEEKHEDGIPPFFEEMHSILGLKHKSNPVHLEDTYERPQERIADDFTHEEQPIDQPREQSNNALQDHTNRFENIRKKVRPSTKRDTILNELKEDRTQRHKEFEILTKHLSKASKQRERFLSILETAFTKSNSHSKKRQRQDSSSSSEAADSE